MNQIFAGSLALILALILWGIGKKPQKVISKQDSFNTFDRDPKSLVHKTNQKKIISSDLITKTTVDWQPPSTEREKISLRRKLRTLMKSNPEDRLIAIQLANKWGNSCVLPIIRRGLKDSDSRVVIAAAQGIEKFKASLLTQEPLSGKSLPRNIFLMR